MSDPQSMVILPNDLIENQSNQIIDMATQTIPPNQTKPIKENDSLNKQMRILKIALLLVKADSFDNDLKIKKSDGSINQNSNMAQLLNLTQTKVRINPGLDDLLHQLNKANVDPDLIINEIIKNKLINLKAVLPTDTSNRDWEKESIESRHSFLTQDTGTNPIDFPQRYITTDQSVGTDTVDRQDVAIGPDIGTRVTRPKRLYSQTFNEENITSPKKRKANSIENLGEHLSDPSINWEIPNDE